MARVAGEMATGVTGAVPAGDGPKDGRRRGLGARLERAIARHAKRRDGTRPDKLLDQRSIYVLPSRPGLFYAAVLVSMLIAAINYRLALGYALTFLLAGLGVVGMLHTYRNLSRLLLRPGRIEPVFAGQIAEFSLIVANRANVQRYAVRVQTPGTASEQVFDLAPLAEHIGSVPITTLERGWHRLPRLTLRTNFPLGLWTAWAYWYPAVELLVYPQPEAGVVALPEDHDHLSEGSSHGPGDEDVAGIRPYQAGDPPKRIAWKAVARTGHQHLLTKTLEGGGRGDLRLDWHRTPPHLGVEARLSRMARWVLDAEAQAARYSLSLPGVEIPPGSGPDQQARCLQALAEVGGRGPGTAA